MGGCAAAGRTVQQFYDKRLDFAYALQEWSAFREWGMIIICVQMRDLMEDARLVGLVVGQNERCKWNDECV